MKPPSAFPQTPAPVLAPPSRAGAVPVPGLREPAETEAAADQALALAARTPDRAGREAFVEIVRRHQRTVCAVAWSVTGRSGLTEDIAQETFFKAWKQIATLRDPARLKAWLTRIARDCAVDALRREKTHAPRRHGSGFNPGGSGFQSGGAVPVTEAGYGTGEEGAVTALCPESPPDKAAADAEEEALVWSALAGLPETWRTPLVLFYREGKSAAAVAEALGLSGDAVKQRLSRGRQALRAAVESRIETVLGRVRPSTLLPAAIAAGLGLLPKPAALAAGIGSGALGSAGPAAGAGVCGAAAGAGVSGAAAGLSATGAAVSAAATTTAAGVAASGAAGLSTVSTFSTFMTATSWLTAALSLAAFLPLGWRTVGPAGPAGGDSAAALAQTAVDPFAAYAGSELLAVWRRLHAEHGSDAAAMPVLYGLIKEEPDKFRRDALNLALMAEWAAVDPEGAYRVLWSEKKNPANAAMMMREWLKRDPDKAAAHLLARLDGSEVLVSATAKDVAELAPHHFMPLLTALPPSGIKNDPSTWQARAFQVYADHHLQAAMEAVPQLNDFMLRPAKIGIAQALAETDPAAGLKWARSLDTQDARREAGEGVMALWAKTDPAAALASLDTSTESRGMADAILSTVAARDLPAALRLWRENSGRTDGNAPHENSGKFDNNVPEAFSPALLREFEKDPAAAMALLNAQPGDMRDKLVRRLDFEKLSPAATDALWTWARTQPGAEAGAAGELCGHLVTAAFQNQDSDALQRLLSLPEASQVAACAQANEFVQYLDPGKFESLLGSVPSAARVPLITAALGSAGAAAEPDEALWRQRLEELPPDMQAVTGADFAGHLVENDPRRAVAFADSLPEGRVRDAAYANVMDNWAAFDSYQASIWADQLPPGSARDAARAVLVQRLLRSQDMEAALTWAAAIGNPELRLNTLSEFDEALSLRGPAAKEAFLNNPLLSPADREALRKRAENP